MTFYSVEVATRINTVVTIFTAMRMRVTNEFNTHSTRNADL